MVKAPIQAVKDLDPGRRRMNRVYGNEIFHSLSTAEGTLKTPCSAWCHPLADKPDSGIRTANNMHHFKHMKERIYTYYYDAKLFSGAVMGMLKMEA